MPTPSSTSNLGNILKTIWEDEMEDLMFGDAPLYAMVPKRTDWDGAAKVVPIMFGHNPGRSNRFANALNNASYSQTTKMTIYPSDNFGVWQVDHKLIQLSRNNRGAVVEALKNETESTMRKFKRSVCVQLYGNGVGSIGRAVTSAGATTGALNASGFYFSEVARSMRALDVGDKISFASTNVSGAAARAVGSVSSVTVTAVNPESGLVTVDSASLDLTLSAAYGDYVFIDGDLDNLLSDTAPVCLRGLEYYVPSSAPSTTAWGMTRTSDPRKLGGIRVGGKNLLIHEAIRKALKVATDQGAKISHIFMNTTDFMNLELTLGTQKRYADEKIGRVGFSGIEISNGNSFVKCFADADCPQNVIWGLQMDTWTLHSAGDYPGFLSLDGRKYERVYNTNSFEGRIGGYAQFYTRAPGYNFRLDLTST